MKGEYSSVKTRYYDASHAQTVIDGLYRDVERRIAASPPGLCPVDLAKSFLDLCHAQTCGKCVPCRIGLGQLSELMEQVLEAKPRWRPSRSSSAWRA